MMGRGGRGGGRQPRFFRRVYRPRRGGYNNYGYHEGGPMHDGGPPRGGGGGRGRRPFRRGGRGRGGRGRNDEGRDRDSKGAGEGGDNAPAVSIHSKLSR